MGSDGARICRAELGLGKKKAIAVEVLGSWVYCHVEVSCEYAGKMESEEWVAPKSSAR